MRRLKKKYLAIPQELSSIFSTYQQRKYLIKCSSGDVISTWRLRYLRTISVDFLGEVNGNINSLFRDISRYSKVFVIELQISTIQLKIFLIQLMVYLIKLLISLNK